MACNSSGFDTLMKERLTDFKNNDSESVFSGYVDTEECYQDLMDSIKALGHSYSVRCSNKPKSKRGKKVSEGSVGLKFQHMTGDSRSIDFFGSPFTILASTMLQCSQGPNYYRNKRQQCNELRDNVNPSRKRTRYFDTKKLDCPAFMRIRCIRYYPDYIIDRPSNRLGRAKVKKGINEAVASSRPLFTILRYYVIVSHENSHSHSVDSAQITQAIHPDLVKEIHRLVHLGLNTSKQIKPLLDQFVDDKFKSLETKPSRLNSAFYPTTKNMHFHIRKASLERRSVTRDFVTCEEMNVGVGATQHVADYEEGRLENSSVDVTDYVTADDVMCYSGDHEGDAAEKDKDAVRLNINDYLNTINNITYQCDDMKVLETLEKCAKELMEKSLQFQQFVVSSEESKSVADDHSSNIVEDNSEYGFNCVVSLEEPSEVENPADVCKSGPKRVRKRRPGRTYPSTSRIGKCVDFEGTVTYVDKRIK